MRPASFSSRDSRPKPRRFGEGDDARLAAAQHASAGCRGRRRRSARATGLWYCQWVMAVSSCAGRSGGVVQRQVEDVEVAQAPRRIDAAQRPVEEQRHQLLGDAAVRAQRRVEARQVVARRAGADARRAAPRRRRRRRSGRAAARSAAAASARDSTTSTPRTAAQLRRQRRRGRRPAAGRRWRTSRASRGGRRTGRSPAG